ncbi:RHS repeat-associated core domain-containing protein [Pseudomonas orientalis]|uniref:RHS repeat-associated core domain-containing protein n=1 Tax=Pseudomonas orientalis TaxID=76758 RepID=UPI002FE3619D
MNIYSNAFNFSTHLNGAVDTRTGQYTVRINLGTLYPQGALDVSRDIALSFSMLSSDKSGHYGAGWSLSNTELDLATSSLTLITGERYQTQSLPSVGGTLVIKDCKLKDVVVKRIAESELHVIYKEGTVEILGRPISSGPFKIMAIAFENGERWNFRYLDGGPLERILDQDGREMLVLTYIDGLLVMADARIEGGRYARTRINYGNANNQLVSVTVPYDSTQVPPGTASFNFIYRQPFRNGLIAITEVKSPMGDTELISYEENGHTYATGQFIPYVTGWRRTPGAGQPPIASVYSYSPTLNFTGYHSGSVYRPGEDNLYLVTGDYDYWTDETLIDTSNNDAVLCVTRTTYNKFHLLSEERVTREGTRVITVYDYNVDPGKLFPDQPANLQLPRQITKRFELVAGGTAREEVQVSETDEYGNVLSRIEPSGVRTEYNYYAVAGESGKCPGDPHELFQRYLKHERLIPVGETSTGRLTEYTHTRVPRTGARYLVLQASCNQAGTFNTEQTYFDTPVELTGRIKSTTSTIDGLSLVSEFSYAIVGDNLSETRRMQGREGQWLESTRILSRVNRRLLSMTRDGGSILALTFDVSGRLTAETVSPAKAQQAARRYAYHFATQAKRAHLITTDGQDNQVITYFDGLGRQVSQAQKLSEEQERVTRTWRYDAQGRTIEMVDTDYLPDGVRSLTSTYAYNRWGNPSRVTHADGSVTIDEYDPQLNIKIEGVEGGERRVTYFNEHNQPVRIERVDADDASVEIESRTYDGWGRCLSARDVNATLTEFSHDAYDRVLTTRQTPADGAAPRLQETHYVPGNSSELVSAISIDGKRLGVRTYDSLGRMTSQARGAGVATTWEYEANWMEPIAMNSPRGDRQTMQYDRELAVPSRIEMTGLPASTYVYSMPSGLLDRSQAGGFIHEFSHDAYGHPEREIQTANGTTLTTEFSHSPGGRLLHQSRADGQRSDLEYDTRGRFCKMTSGALIIEQSYDNFGRPRNFTTTWESLRVLMQLSYDSLGREAERRIEQNGVLLKVMASTYYVNGMLATRFLRDANAQLVIGETFTYDAYLRLKTYRCEGLEQPKDRQGRGIVGQDFSFDGLNNITRVVTFFADGTQDTCQRFFTGNDPTQLTRLTHTRPAQDLTLTYDAAGNLQAGPTGQVYTFNGYEQLASVQDDTFDYHYCYDAQSRQVLMNRGDETPVMLAYAGNRLDTLVEGSRQIRYHERDKQAMARSGGVDGPQLHTLDAAGSVRGISSLNEAPVSRHYTPYGITHIALDDGKARTLADLQLPAFNGERLDAAAQLYFLGNGRRIYIPELMIFLQPDPLSPFDEGGINSYAYCACNPVNLMDPSGWLPVWMKWVLTGAALVLGTVALASGVAGIVAVGWAAATAMQIVGLLGTASGIVASTLGVTALSIEAVDKAKGWDRSHHIQNLGWAAFGFSMASWGINAYKAWNAASKVYDAAKVTGIGKTPAGPMTIDVPLRDGVNAALKSLAGRNFKFGTKLSTGSKTFGSTRAVIRTVNLMRTANSRYDALTPKSSGPKDDSRNQSYPVNPQSEPMQQQWGGMTESVAGYYQTFREEAIRIREPILREIYTGA